MNTSLMDCHTQSIYFNWKSFPPTKQASFTMFYTHPVIARSFSPSHFQKARGQRNGSCVTWHRFHSVLYGSHTSSPYDLEGTPFIVGAFLVSRSSPMLDPNSAQLSVFWGVRLLWMGDTQYVKAGNNLILRHHCVFRHVLWDDCFPFLGFIRHS